MRTKPGRDLRARIAIRDRLLLGILGHLRKRDPYFAALTDRAIQLVLANDRNVLEGRLGRDIRAFARMELTPGNLKPIPAGPGTIRAAKLNTWFVESYIRTAQEERDLDDPPANLIHEVWKQCLDGTQPLTPPQIQQVLKLKTTEGKALRLVFWATRRYRKSQERFEDFRKQVSRYNVRPHPWIAR